jgi:hypothetical protein
MQKAIQQWVAFFVFKIAQMLMLANNLYALRLSIGFNSPNFVQN